MVPHQHHLEVSGDPVDRPETGGGADGEGELPEGLFAVAGPHVEVVHIQTFDADVAVDVKAHKAEEEQCQKLPYPHDPMIFVSFIHVIQTLYDFNGQQALNPYQGSAAVKSSVSAARLSATRSSSAAGAVSLFHA